MAWKTIHLTSPRETGADVTEAQQLLTHNRFKDFRPGKIDGIYGEHSHTATRKAKYWCGYKKRDINGAFGQRIHDILLSPEHEHHRTLTKMQKVRRNIRLKLYDTRKKKRDSLAHIQVRSLAYAKTQVGVSNPGDPNKVKYSIWYGFLGAWCAMFQCYSWIVGGGYDKGVSWERDNRWAYVPFMVDDARSNLNGLETISSIYAEPGDLVAYDWNHDGTADHVEMFDGWIVGGESFWGVGGNVGAGVVAVSERYMSEVQTFMKVVH